MFVATTHRATLLTAGTSRIRSLVPVRVITQLFHSVAKSKDAVVSSNGIVRRSRVTQKCWLEFYVRIPRGGLVTGDIVARKLSSRLGIIIPRKLTDPDNKEYAIGAIMEDVITYIDQEAVNHLQISAKYLEQ